MDMLGQPGIRGRWYVVDTVCTGSCRSVIDAGYKPPIPDEGWSAFGTHKA